MSGFSREVVITIADKSGNQFLKFEMNPAEFTVEQLKHKIMKKREMEDIRRVHLTLNDEELTRNDKTLFESGVKEDVKITFSDPGRLISKRMGCLIGYIPPLMVLALLYWSTPKPNTLQKTAFTLGCLHYVKHIYEAFSIHRFSDAALPLSDVIGISLAYYTGIMALGVGIPLRNIDRDPSRLNVYFWAAVMIVFEFLNFMAHRTQAQLRVATKQDLEDIKAGKLTEAEVHTRYKIPYGWGFDYVSNANYLWETCTWFAFAMLTRLTFAWIFAFLTLAVLISWSHPRHQRYKKVFDGENGRELYPKERKALIPFIY